MLRRTVLAAMAAAYFVCLVAPKPAQAQLWTWTKDQMVEYTKAWTGERFPDGRPKVPDSFLERAKEMSQEEIIVPGGGRGGGSGVASQSGGYSQYEEGFQTLHPDLKMVGRAFTVAFMPSRSDLDAVVNQKAKDKGVSVLNNAYVVDQLQAGDVLVVDMFGKKESAVIDSTLFQFIMKATKNGGLVVDGAIRSLDAMKDLMMPAYYRSSNPAAVSGASLAAINVPIRIGNVTVMPGDLVVGDKEGVSFIPPQSAEGILDRADETHVHDQWTRRKFDEGKYVSTDIYSSPRDPELQKEYREYLAKRLAEIRAERKK